MGPAPRVRLWCRTRPAGPSGPGFPTGSPFMWPCPQPRRRLAMSSSSTWRRPPATSRAVASSCSSATVAGAPPRWSGRTVSAGAGPGTAAADYTHVYNRAGRWELSLQVANGDCGNDNIYGALNGYVAIEPGTPSPQGPAQPRVIVAEARAPGQPVIPGALEVYADGSDDDGYVARLRVDFGDGSPPDTRPGDAIGCRSTPSGWPAASSGRTAAPYPTHQYVAPGSPTSSPPRWCPRGVTGVASRRPAPR